MTDQVLEQAEIQTANKEASSVTLNTSDNNELPKNQVEAVKKGRNAIFIWLIFIILSTTTILILFRNNFSFQEKNKKLDEINVRLKWLHQAQFAGLYVADKAGLYQKSGIKATLLPFDYTHLPIDEIASGTAQFGVAGADEVLISRSKGIPVKALAVIFQQSPVVAYTKKSSGIENIADFRNKKLGMEPIDNILSMTRSMLKTGGIDYMRDLTEVNIGFDAKEIINDEVDISTGYVMNEPRQLQDSGIEVTIIKPETYGIQSYGDVLVASEGMITNNPDLVKRFVEATLAGWEQAIENQKQAVDYTLQFPDPNNKALTEKHQTDMLADSIPFIKPSEGTSIGVMQSEKWKKTYQILKENGFIKNDINVRDAYTIEFLQ